MGMSVTTMVELIKRHKLLHLRAIKLFIYNNQKYSRDS